MVFCGAFGGGSKWDKHLIGWRELSSIYKEREISSDVCWVAALRWNFNRCAKTAKTCTKNINYGGWTIHWRSASGEKQKISTHFLLGETFGGRLFMPQKPRRRQKRVTEYRCVQTAASRPQQLKIYVQSSDAEQTFSTHSTSSKTTEAVLFSIPRNALSALTPECVPHSRSRRPQVQVWIAFVFTGVSFSCSCVCFIHRIVLRFLSWMLRSDFIALRSKKMGTKSSPDDNEEVLQ